MMESVIFLHQGAELYGSDHIFYLVVREASRICNPVVVLDSEGPLVARIREITDQIHILPLGVLRRKSLHPVGLFALFREILNAVKTIRRLAGEANARLIYTNTIGVLPGMIAARTLGLPNIVHVHEIIKRPRIVGMVLATLVTGLATRVVAVSTPVKEQLDHDALVKNDKVVVIHNGISTKDFDFGEPGRIREEFGLTARTLLIAMVGRLHFWKGQDFLLDAAAIAKHRGLDHFRILFFGDVFPGYEDLRDRLKEQAREQGLHDDVVFAGFRADAPSLFLDSDIVVLPSTLPDPLPTVVLEAMAARKPVLATAHGGALEMVADGETGYLVDPEDPADMAGRILLLAGDQALREEMGRKGRQRLEAYFSEQRFSDDIRALIADQAALATE